MKITLAFCLACVNHCIVTLDDQVISSAAVLNGSSTVQRHNSGSGGGIDSLPNAAGVYRIIHIPTGREYVGSSKDIRHRRNRHFMMLRHGTHSNKHLQSAYNKYGRSEFEFHVLELCSAETRIEREQYYLDQRKPEFNWRLTAEPTGGWHHSEESKAKIGAASKGMKRPAELFQRIVATRRARNNYTIPQGHREKMVEGMRRYYKNLKESGKKRWNYWKGKKQPRWLVKKRADAIRGRKLSPQHAAKARVASLGRVQPLEERLRRGNSLRGIKRTAEWRANLSRSLIGRRLSEESRRKISEKLKGRSLTDETRAKLRLVNKTRQREKGRFV